MTQTVEFTRKIDELGRIVLPLEIREMLNLKNKDAIQLLIDREKDVILLQKVPERCFKDPQGEPRNIQEHRYVCESCIQALRIV